MRTFPVPRRERTQGDINYIVIDDLPTLVWLGNLANLDRARTQLESADVEFVHARYAITDPGAYDLVVIPLSFDGDRRAIYARPPGCAVIVHDWIWNRRGTSRIVSVALLKRINLVRP